MAPVHTKYHALPMEDPLDLNPAVPKERGKISETIAIIFMIVGLCISCTHGSRVNLIALNASVETQPQASSSANDNQKNGSDINLESKYYRIVEYILSITFGELLLMLVLAAEEVKHLSTRYNGKIHCMLQSIYNPHLGFLFLISCILMLISWNHPYNLNYLLCGAYPILNIKLGPKFIMQKENIQTLGSAMAQGSFATYYSQVLKGLRERICKFEKDHQIVIQPKKLVMLFPTSCKIASKIEDFLGRALSKFGELEPYGTNIAGSERTFTLDVYRLKALDGKNYYCLLHFPSCLLSLRVSQAKKSAGCLVQDESKHEIDIFYRELTKLCQMDIDCAETFIPLKYSSDEPHALIKRLTSELQKFSRREECIA